MIFSRRLFYILASNYKSLMHSDSLMRNHNVVDHRGFSEALKSKWGKHLWMKTRLRRRQTLWNTVIEKNEAVVFEMAELSSRPDIEWEKCHKSLLTATNSSEEASRLRIIRQAPSWMACTHLTWAGVAQRDWPALHLPAVLSLGTRWMTYSLCEVSEPVTGENRGNEKTTCIRDDKTRRGFSGCPACSGGHSSRGTQMQSMHLKLKRAQQAAQTDSPVTGVL